MTPWEQKGRSSCEKEKASRKERKEKYMVIYAKVQMTGNWPQTPDCVIISPSTTACSSARGKDGERLERKEENKMSEDLPNTNKNPKQACFLLARAGLSIQPPWVFFFKLHHCLALIVVLFVRVQAGPGRGGGIKKKKGQFDGCLLISRPLGL